MEYLTDISQWAIKASIQGGLLAGTLWFVYRARRTAGLFGVQYILGFLVITRLCLPATPSVAVHPWHWLAIPKSSAANQSEAIRRSPTPPSSAAGSGVSVSAIPTKPPHPIQKISATLSLTNKEILALLWGLGCVFGLIRLLRAHARHRTLIKSCAPLTDASLQAMLEILRKKLGIRRPVQLLESPHIASAAVTGSLHTKLIVSPRFLHQLTPQQQQHVLTHELIHIKRFDPLINWISLILQAVHWFNPLVHWALKKFQQDRELVCDAIAIKTLGEDQRRAYGETLIEILMSFRQQRTFPNLVPIISNKHEIKRRIMMISKNQSSQTKRPVLLFAALAVVMALSFTKPGLVKAQVSEQRITGYTISQGDPSDADFTIESIDLVASSTSTRVKLRDVTSRESRSGVLVAPGTGKQMYNVHEIDLTAFPDGGVLVIDIRMGDGESAGSFDLFPEGVPLPSASPEGSVARQYDVAPGESRTLVHQFTKGGTFRFGASGNWFSEQGTTNDFEFEARAIPVTLDSNAHTNTTNIREFHIEKKPRTTGGTIHFSTKENGNTFSTINNDEGKALNLSSNGTATLSGNAKQSVSIFRRHSKEKGNSFTINSDKNEIIEIVPNVNLTIEPQTANTDSKKKHKPITVTSASIIELEPETNVTIISSADGKNEIRTDRGVLHLRSNNNNSRSGNTKAKSTRSKKKSAEGKGIGGEIIRYQFDTKKKDSKESEVSNEDN